MPYRVFNNHEQDIAVVPNFQVLPGGVLLLERDGEHHVEGAYAPGTWAYVYWEDPE